MLYPCFASSPGSLHCTQMRHAALPSLRHSGLAKRVAPSLLRRLRHLQQDLQAASSRRRSSKVSSAQWTPQSSYLQLSVRASTCATQPQPAASFWSSTQQRLGPAVQSRLLMVAGSNPAALSRDMAGLIVVSAASDPCGSGILLYQVPCSPQLRTHCGAGWMS